jgi:hypothetical protein
MQDDKLVQNSWLDKPVLLYKKSVVNDLGR